MFTCFSYFNINYVINEYNYCSIITHISSWHKFYLTTKGDIQLCLFTSCDLCPINLDKQSWWADKENTDTYFISVNFLTLNVPP